MKRVQALLLLVFLVLFANVFQIGGVFAEDTTSDATGDNAVPSITASDSALTSEDAVPLELTTPSVITATTTTDDGTDVPDLTSNDETGINTQEVDQGISTMALLNSLTIHATDATETTSLKGATFILYKTTIFGNLKIGTKTTDADGDLSFTLLVSGGYILKETSAPDGYVLPDPASTAITLNSSTTMTIKHDKIVRDVELTKTDGTTGEALSGALYTIQKTDGTFSLSRYTDSNGKIKLTDLDPGSYEFLEAGAPTDYQIDTTAIPFEITENQIATIELTAKNALIPGSVELTEANQLAGSVFKLVNSDGTTVQENLTTDADGKIKVTDLRPGYYEFIETSVPSGYVLDPTPIPVTISRSQASILNITVEDTKTCVILTKIDATTEEGVAGAEITIYDEEGTMVSQTTTDADGNTIIEGLPIGTYTFEETVAPDGYIINTSIFDFTINENGEPSEDSVTTIMDTKTSVTLTKTDTTTGVGLAGSEIAIYNASGEMVSQTITDDNGNTTIEGLSVGDYTFEELTPPIGYSRSTETYAFTINPDGTTTGDLGLTDSKTVVTLSKADATTAAGVPDAEITIYDEEGTIVSQTTTDADGNTTIEGLPVGTYTFEETVAPSGYVINTTIFEFTINSDGTIDGDTIVTDKKTSVTLVKRDSQTTTGLTGAEFTIYNEDGEIVSVTTTELMGKTTIEGLPVGTYTFKETGVPEGYTGSTQTYSFTIAEDGTITGDTFVNNDPIILTNPNTGVDANASWLLVGLVLLSLSVLGVDQKRRKLQ